MTSMKKFLVITNDFGPRIGGIESFVNSLVERMPRGEVLVYTSSQEGQEEYDRRLGDEFGIQVIRDPYKVLLPTPLVVRRIQKVIEKTGTQFIWFGASAPLALMADSLRKPGIEKIVATTHGHELWWVKAPITRKLFKRIVKSVDVITYLGDFIGSQLKNVVPPEQRVKFVKLAPGVDHAHFVKSANTDDLRNKHDLDGKRILISVGRLVPRKGQDRLIQVMKNLGSDVHLLICGHGEYEKDLKTLARNLGLSERVHFLGKVSYADLPRYLSLAEIFAMPARNRLGGLEVEGLGIVYLEASSCSLPVIVGNSGGAPDAVIPGVTGYIVDGNNLEEIERSISELLSNPEQAAQMGIEGRNWIEREWTWDAASAIFLKLFIGND